MRIKDQSLETITKTMMKLLPVQIVLAGLPNVNAMVSGLFASNIIGETAMSAVALYDPVNKFVTALGMMLSAGSAIVCGKHMGRQEREKMQGAFSLDVFLAIIISIIFGILLMLMGISGRTGFLTGDQNVAPQLHSYMIGQSIGILPLILGVQLSTFLSLENRMKRTVVASVTFIAANILFNFIFVKVLSMGTFGLALAASLGQWLFCIMQLQFFFTKEASLHFTMKGMVFSEILDIIKIGLPGALSMAYQTVRGLIVNNLVTTHVGSVGLSAFGACNNLLGIVWAVPFGMVAVTRMMMGVSVGEEDRKTLVNILKVMWRRFVPMMGGISLLIIILAVPLTNLFYQNPADAVYAMTVAGFRILPICMPLSIIYLHFSCYGESSGKQVYIHTLALIDGVIGVALFTALFIKSMGINAVYWASSFNGILTSAFIIGYSWILRKKMPKSTEDLMVIADDFGVADDERMDISINKMEDVIKISGDIQKFCLSKGIDERRSYLAGLAMEEMAGNIVEHGFTKDNKKHSVDVRVVHKEDDIILRLRDDCVPFNPEERSKMTNPEDPASNIGLRMIYSMAPEINYQSILGMNVLTIRI